MNKEKNKDIELEPDFSNGIQGKFFRSISEHKIPFYLDSSIQESLLNKAKSLNIDAEVYMNTLVKKLLKSG
ncbi:MAG: hypothetical protein KDK38_02905 [Leptospiraceae bacterium]|nr:hypothetical protein [Leptospiraceae bacterium]